MINKDEPSKEISTISKDQLGNFEELKQVNEVSDVQTMQASNQPIVQESEIFPHVPTPLLSHPQFYTLNIDDIDDLQYLSELYKAKITFQTGESQEILYQPYDQESHPRCFTVDLNNLVDLQHLNAFYEAKITAQPENTPHKNLYQPLNQEIVPKIYKVELNNHYQLNAHQQQQQNYLYQERPLAGQEEKVQEGCCDIL